MSRRNAWPAIGALAAIVAVAVLLRFVDLAANPGGLYGDEAAEGLDAALLLHQPGFHPDFLVWFPDDAGREALFGYVVAGAFWLFGQSVLVLRATAAAFGVAGVLGIGVLGRRFGQAAQLDLGVDRLAALVAVERVDLDRFGPGVVVVRGEHG